MTHENLSPWARYLQEKMDVNVTITTDGKDDKGGNPFGKKDKAEKKDNPFAKKDDGDKEEPEEKSEKKDNPFAKKEDKGDDKEGKKNPFEKKEWAVLPSWTEWKSKKN